MTTVRTHLVRRTEPDWLDRWSTAVVGKRLARVDYIVLSGGDWSTWGVSAFGHLVDEVVLGFEGDGSVSITWTTPGWSYGLSLEHGGPVGSLAADPESRLRVGATDMTEWSPLIGQIVAAVEVAWSGTEIPGEETLFAIRLSLAGHRSVVLALGEEEGGALKWMPDSIMAIFDPSIADRYVPPTNWMPSAHDIHQR